MPSEYAKKPEEYEEEEEEEEEPEEEEEEQEEWNELVELEELEELEDGPSTYFVGGFSTAHKLSEPLNAVQYQQDRILIYPGVYGNGTQQPHETLQEEIIVDEARLRGLSIEGVPFARGVKAGYPSARQERQQDAFAGTVHASGGIASAGSTRRVGPWFLQAAAAAQSLAEQEGKIFITDEERAAKTTMGSSVYQSMLTCTALDPAHYPVLASKLIFTYPGADGSADTPAENVLRRYEQEKDEEAEDEGEDGNDDGEDERGTEGSETAASGRRHKKSTQTSVSVQGICIVYGVELRPLSRALLRHDVIGVPTARHPQFAHQMPSAVVAHPLAEARLERCVIFGGTQHGLYAYPRSQVHVRSCVIDGPSPSAHYRNLTGVKRADRHLSGLARLEHRARQRLAASQATKESAYGMTTTTANANGTASGATLNNNQSALPAGELARFVTPESTCCEVGLFADDADLVVQDVLISNTKLGLLCHDACTGMSVTASDVRSIEQVGVYVYGAQGGARLVQNSVRACGRECLVIAGPTDAQVAALQAAYVAEHGEAAADADEDGNDEDEEEEGEAAQGGHGGAAQSRRPIFAAHPSIRHCWLSGAVRLQGAVREGAMVDNLVFQPVEEGPLSVKAMGTQGAAHKLLIQPNFGVSGNWTCDRGFHFVGVEGVSLAPPAEV